MAASKRLAGLRGGLGAEPHTSPRGNLGEFARATGLRAEHVPDAHLAALALEHGLAVVSADADFSRFPNLRLENPVA
ncbi:MAG: PIN domain-containing protein [Planctomycetota bacterium]